MSTLEERIERLERQSKKMRIGVVALAISLVTLAVVSNNFTDTQEAYAQSGTSKVVKKIKVANIEIVNDEGKVVGEFGADADGQCRLIITNPQGTGNAMLTSGEEGGGLYLFDNNKKLRISAVSDMSGVAMLTVSDPNEPRISMNTYATGDSSINMTRDNKAKLSCWVDPEGKISTIMRGEDKSEISITPENNVFSINIQDKSGNKVWSAPAGN